MNKTYTYFQSIWQEDIRAAPRFLWNAKMRFGKTFTAYQLAKKFGAKRTLVVTFKPAVEDAWQTDLESHIDFDDWQYLSRNSGRNPTELDPHKPVVYFGSFQDLLGRDGTGNIKPKIEEQIFNWTYTDEQRAKEDFAQRRPDQGNPYGALPQLRLLTYQMPDELIAIASAGEFDEFDLNAFFETSGAGLTAEFKHKSDVQKWLDILRGGYAPQSLQQLKTGTRPPFPYSDARLLPYLQHSFWFLPNVGACQATANLLAEKQNTFWRDYRVIVAAAGIGLDALPPVRRAIASGFETKTITFSRVNYLSSFINFIFWATTSDRLAKTIPIWELTIGPCSVSLASRFPPFPRSIPHIDPFS